MGGDITVKRCEKCGRVVIGECGCVNVTDVNGKVEMLTTPLYRSVVNVARRKAFHRDRVFRPFV